MYAEAEREAKRLLGQAQADADAVREEVEDYVDAKLATFEVVLTKTLAAVERGREKLAGRRAGRAGRVRELPRRAVAGVTSALVLSPAPRRLA